MHTGNNIFPLDKTAKVISGPVRWDWRDLPWQSTQSIHGILSASPQRPHLHAQRWSWSHHGSLDRSPSSGFSSAIHSRSKDPKDTGNRTKVAWWGSLQTETRDLSACCRIGDITVESTWFPRGAFLIPNTQPGCLQPSVGCGQVLEVSNPFGYPHLSWIFNRILIGFSMINHSFTHFGVASFMAPPAAAPIQVTSLARRRTGPAECCGPHP